MRKIHWLVGAGLVAALAAASPAAQTAVASHAVAAAGPALRPDPAIRFGVLPNGMHYEILRNATPPHNASLRLRIDVGSMYEHDDQRGHAEGDRNRDERRAPAQGVGEEGLPLAARDERRHRPDDAEDRGIHQRHDAQAARGEHS